MAANGPKRSPCLRFISFLIAYPKTTFEEIERKDMADEQCVPHGAIEHAVGGMYIGRYKINRAISGERETEPGYRTANSPAYQT
jgi:hypothetical protein